MLMTLRQFLTYERYNTRLDGAGTGAIEIDARWDTDLEQRELMPGLAQLRSKSRNAIIVNIAWFIGEVVGSGKSLRAAADSWLANVKSEEESARFIQMVESFTNARDLAQQFEQIGQAVYAYWVQADVLRRVDQKLEAEQALSSALDLAEQTEDQGQIAFIQMTKGDWLLAPFGQVMTWDFSLAASYNQDSSLDPLIEAREHQVLDTKDIEKALAYYQEAAKGYEATKMDRGFGHA